MSLDLDAIKQRAEAATEGPWIKRTPNRFADSWIQGADIAGYRSQVALRISDERDAEFIAHARTDVPALLAEVERLQGVVERVRELHVPTEMYPSGIIACKECCSLPNACYARHKAYGNTCQYPCPTIRALEGP